MRLPVRTSCLLPGAWQDWQANWSGRRCKGTVTTDAAIGTASAIIIETKRLTNRGKILCEIRFSQLLRCRYRQGTTLV